MNGVSAAMYPTDEHTRSVPDGMWPFDNVSCSHLGTDRY